MRRLLLLTTTALILGGQALAAPAASAAGQVLGSGSTYVGIAMQDWVGASQREGIQVGYTPVGSPTGISQYGSKTVDFAGTEAEVRSLDAPAPSRGYQYVPDVAGALSVMYNLTDAAGHKVDYLHLDQATVGRIFTGEIRSWADPAISRTNAGIKFPDKPIRLVSRSGQSGTTALFYDFVRYAARASYDRWAKAYGAPSGDVRVVQVPDKFVRDMNGQAFGDSDQIAQYIASPNGAWSIGYDEFGYGKRHGAPSAWLQNGAGKYVLPYAENISAALESATLRPDLSQELGGVYTSKNPKAYPASAYSYLMVQCSPAPDRSTCKGAYSDADKAATLDRFMRLVACEGQVNMAAIGYSPLPPNLSQEMINAVARLAGHAPDRLTAANCVNPRFHGSLGAGASSPPDPFDKLPGGVNGATNGGTSHGGAAGPGGTGPGGTGPGGTTTSGVPGRAGVPGAGADAVGGGSNDWQQAKPEAYASNGVAGLGGWALLVLGVAILAPLVFVTAARARSRRSRGSSRSSG